MSIHACVPIAELTAVPFTLSSPGARRVLLAFFFNAPPPGPAPLPADATLRREVSTMVAELLPLTEAEPGRWRCEALLRPGPCEYLFLVDGEWVMDPEAPGVRPDGAGGYNAVRPVGRGPSIEPLPSTECAAEGIFRAAAGPRAAGSKRRRHPAGNFVHRGKTAWPTSRPRRPAKVVGV